MTRDKLIELAREHIDIPDDTEHIEYDYYNGSSRLIYVNDTYTLGKVVKYTMTITFTGDTLEITAAASEPFADSWYKIIKL